MAKAEQNASRLQAQLDQAQSWYRGLVEGLPAFTYIDVADDRPSDGYRTIEASPQIEDMLGYTPQEFLQDPELWGRMLHPDDRERQFAEDAHLWETGEPYVSEYRLFARDGRVVWVRNHAALVRGGPGSLTVAQGVLYDITDSKYAEEALRSSEARFRSLLENAPEGVLTVDSDGIIVFVNRESERLFGYGPGELVGRSVEELVPESVRGGHEAHRRRYQDDPGVHSMGEGLKLNGRRRDGTVFPVEISLNSLPDEDRGSIVVAFVRDVAERTQTEQALADAEQKYRTLVERIPAIVYSAEFGEPGPWLYVSPHAEWILGYPSEDWIADSGLWMRLIHPDDLERTLEEERRSKAHGTPFTCEYRMCARDGRTVWIRDEAEVVRDGSGAPVQLRGIMYDVTERKRTEEALEEAERRYRGVFENAAEAIFVTALDGSYLMANPALAEMLGYSSPQELIDLMPDVAGLYVDPSWREEFLRRLDREDTLRGFEYQVTRRDGTAIWVSENVRAVRDANGRLIGSEGMSTDITARKHAEQALISSEERFRQLSEAAFEGVIVDVGGHIVQANRAFCEMFGLSHDEVIGSSPADALAPESLPRIDEYLRSGSQTPEDIEVVRKDGSHLIIETTIRRVERDGQEAHLITMHDVTVRRAIEDLLRRRDAILGAVTFAAERFLDGPWEADIDGVLARLGEATISSRVCLFRNEPGDDGAPLMTLGYEWAAPGVSTTIDDPANACFPYEGEYASWVRELGAGHIIHGSRSDFPEVLAEHLEAEDVVSIALVPVFAGDAWWGYMSFDDCVDERVWSGSELGLLNTVAGVLGGAIARTNAERALSQINTELEERVTERTTDVVVAMQEAQRAKESAEFASRAKSEFLSRASHELRTPLNAILGFGQLLEGSALPEDDLECVEEIVKAGRHLLELVNEVLDISGLEAGRLAFSIEPVSIDGVVHEALDVVGPQALVRGIRLRTKISPDGLHVMADRLRLEQVLLHLLSNAVKFDREEGTITVTCDASEERVVLRVADTGSGIEPGSMKRLFAPFDRLGAEATASVGTGLGLTLSKALVDAMGGTITVESAPDAGTTFAVELPRAEAPAQNEVVEPPSTRAASA